MLNLAFPAAAALGLGVVLSVLDWVAVAMNKNSFHMIFKATAMLAILAAGWLITLGPHDARMAQFLIPGFVFALAGDILLVLPGESLFLAGIAAFLVTQMCYLLGLNPTVPPWPAPLVAVAATPIGIWLYRRIAQCLRDQGHQKLLVPVAIYSLALTLTLFSGWAGLFRPEWTVVQRMLVLTGTTLFFFSDATLAWNRFVCPLSWGPLGVIATYHLAQLALAAAIGFPV